MRTIIFDTETTDLFPGEICQLAYIIVDTELGIKARNHFFEVDYVNPSAERVHGFSVDKLKRLSGGKRFRDLIDEIERDFAGADVLSGHNVSFDIRFMREEFARLDRRFRYKSEYCTMKEFTDLCRINKGNGKYKYPKLEELIAFFGIESKDISDRTKALFDSMDADNDYHDARYDTTATYLCLLKAKQMRNGA